MGNITTSFQHLKDCPDFQSSQGADTLPANKMVHFGSSLSEYGPQGQDTTAEPQYKTL